MARPTPHRMTLLNNVATQAAMSSFSGAEYRPRSGARSRWTRPGEDLLEDEELDASRVAVCRLGDERREDEDEEAAVGMGWVSGWVV